MPQQILRGYTYTNYPGATSQVTATNLNGHVDDAILLPGAISSQTSSTAQEVDYVMVERSGSLYKYTLESIRNLFSSLFLSKTGGTMTGDLTLANSTPTSAPMAASKGYVDSAISAALYPGLIMLWGGTTPPSGWLECNGQSIVGYPTLTPIYGTNLPDLRGEFVRGWDNARGVDSGRTILSPQAQDVQPHAHMPPAGYQYVSDPFTGSGDIPTSSGSGAGQRNGVTIASSNNTGSETRPRNVALMYIVKI